MVYKWDSLFLKLPEKAKFTGVKLEMPTIKMGQFHRAISRIVKSDHVNISRLVLQDKRCQRKHFVSPNTKG